MSSDRIFGLIAAVVALAYIASATQIKSGFMTDPVGPKGFPLLVGSVAAVCAMFMVFKPDESPTWPELRTLGSLLLSVVVLVCYAYALKPLGFLVPTALAAGILSYQISPGIKSSIGAGLGLSVTLFVIFKYALGLGLYAFPKWLIG
ncbi:MAG: tripartite tricarboxylate transporter TctB family protein [Desulfofustis sp.]|nr:tripartite tricarboxylate transporter TctB family protein [Desulfofustis sp.]NNF46884.1 tripartite tricarboxylate transporter TctB family protein [Desulfofustis sp.]NNK56994.1 tripartite tricarboxylate transporter TctB family protein [Desulfofustis sp.]